MPTQQQVPTQRQVAQRTGRATSARLTASELARSELADPHDRPRPLVELCRIHVPMAWRTALAITADPAEATDAVTRAFTQILSAGAPGETAATPVTGATALRPQLLAATREAAVRAMRRSGATRARPAQTRPAQAEEPSRVTDAFRRLPERWRTVLWLVEVERIPAGEAARIIGVPPEDIAALTAKAWAGLAEASIGSGRDAPTPVSPACPTRGHLVECFSGNLPAGQRTEMRAHLGTCASCAGYQTQLEALGTTLRQVVMPLPEGLLAAATAAAPPTKPPSPQASPRTSSNAGKPLVRAWLAALGLAIIGVAVLDQSSTPLPPASPHVTPVLPQASPTQVLSSNPGAQPSTITPSQQHPSAAVTNQGALPTRTTDPATATRSDHQTGTGVSSSKPPGATAPSGGTPQASGGGTSGAPVLVLPPAATPQLVAVDTGVLGIPVALNVGTCTGLQLGPLTLGCSSP